MTTNSEPETNPKKILVVDDEPEIVEIVSRYLSDDGFIVCRAYDGADGVFVRRRAI